MLKKANDPITLEIIQNSLQATADEMFAVMKKTAMSSIIYEVLDMGTGITDAKGAQESIEIGVMIESAILLDRCRGVQLMQRLRFHRSFEVEMEFAFGQVAKKIVHTEFTGSHDW